VWSKAGNIVAPLLAGKTETIRRYHQMHDQLRRPREAPRGRRPRRGERVRGPQGHGRELGRHAQADAIESGKPDPGPYQGTPTFGLATKTARYALGMMGGGNAVVPDTHFVRHIFGLHPDHDAGTNEYLKSVLWSPINHEAMNGIDRWYVKNHPAVKHMLNHPTWGKHFKTPDDAAFPAFWRHWMTIVPDENRRGLMRTKPHHNEHTTHAPFWSAIRPFMGKSEGSGDLPLHTALVHQQYQQAFGDVPASMLYASYLLPRLLDAAGQRVNLHGAAALLAGAHPQLERLSAELRGAADARTPSHGNDALWPGGPTVRKLSYDREGGKHAAGRVMTIDNQIVHLEDPHGLLAAVLPEGPIDARKTAILHGLENSSHVSVETDHDYLRDQPDLHPTLGRLPPPMDTGEPQFQPTEPDPTLPPPVDGVETYHYKRAGMDAPAVLEVSGDAAYLDGRPVPAALVRLMQANVRRGSASLVPAALAKAGEPPHPGMDRASTLDHINAAVAAGHVPAAVRDALARHLYEDPVTQGLGNQHAWGEFQRQNRPGVYIQMDGNGLKALNDTHGHAAGTAAIQHMGRALREATDEVKGRGGKQATAFRTPDEHDLWRNGGDEFIAHVPSYGHAIRLVNAVRNKLDAVPPIGGTHKHFDGVRPRRRPAHGGLGPLRGEGSKEDHGRGAKMGARHGPTSRPQRHPGQRGAVEPALRGPAGGCDGAPVGPAGVPARAAQGLVLSVALVAGLAGFAGLLFVVGADLKDTQGDAVLFLLVVGPGLGFPLRVETVSHTPLVVEHAVLGHVIKIARLGLLSTKKMMVSRRPGDVLAGEEADAEEEGEEEREFPFGHGAHLVPHIALHASQLPQASGAWLEEPQSDGNASRDESPRDGSSAGALAARAASMAARILRRRSTPWWRHSPPSGQVQNRFQHPGQSARLTTMPPAARRRG
jgi:GGDEF domain-containing protein